MRQIHNFNGTLVKKFTISITLSITIWGYLSRFSANHYAEVTEFIYEQNPLPMGRKQARHVSVRFKG